MKDCKLLQQMRTNPRDWRIDDVEQIAHTFGCTCSAPRRGSHYKVGHSAVEEILTIPAQRPIKPCYIRNLVKLIDRVRNL